METETEYVGGLARRQLRSIKIGYFMLGGWVGGTVSWAIGQVLR